MTTQGDLNRINEGATFQPQLPGGDTRPCLTVAGIQVYAYIEHVDDFGPTLVVSIDYDTAGQTRHVVGEDSADSHLTDGVILDWSDGIARVAPLGEPHPTEIRVGPRVRLAIGPDGGLALTTDA